jgi:hypothetical protein
MALVRHIGRPIAVGLRDRPVVLLNGARQTGKTTLVRELLSDVRRMRYLTFDDAPVLAAAQTDPAGFVAGLGDPVVLDEIQRAPELFVALKAAVDRDRRPGRFLLTGSANVLLLPRLSESLAGRMEIHTLRGFSQGELEGRREGFIDAVFARTFTPPAPSADLPRALVARVLRGGFPEPALKRSAARRATWFRDYVATLLQRDVRELANVEGLTALPHLLAVLATRSAGLFNLADVSRVVGLPQTTLKRYLTLLEALFLIEFLPAWHARAARRLVKAPKLFVSDSGLAAHLLGVEAAHLRRERRGLGPLLETFVVAELRKQAAWSRTRPGLHHFRTQSGREVDVVLEDARGRVVGVDVKAAMGLGSSDWHGLRALREAAGARFVRGVVLYGGQEPLPFGPDLWALPVDALWRLGTAA